MPSTTLLSCCKHPHASPPTSPPHISFPHPIPSCPRTRPFKNPSFLISPLALVPQTHKHHHKQLITLLSLPPTQKCLVLSYLHYQHYHYITDITTTLPTLPLCNKHYHCITNITTILPTLPLHYQRTIATSSS